MAMAHTQTEHSNSPAITDLTIQWACRNRCSSDRFDDVSPGVSVDTMSARVVARVMGVLSALRPTQGRTAAMTGARALGRDQRAEQAAASSADQDPKISL